VRFHTVTGKPAVHRRRAMGAPINPVPSKLILIDGLGISAFQYRKGG
jgi:hypothetical protein